MAIALSDQTYLITSEQQQMLIDIVKHRLVDERRHEIAQRAKEAIAAFHRGELRPQSVEDIIAELRETLDHEE